MTIRYTDSPFVGKRRATRVVNVGAVGIGGDNPIRVQSMTTTDTRDTQATADQVEQLADAGCEIVRITAPSITDAENLRLIRAELARRGVRVPLVADIHFTPNAAMIAAEIVEKVRVNPGNYADKKKFAVREYTEVEYAAELERIAERFRPLVLRLKERGGALRIGTNHGSLSDRIMNRYGDTPLGMVESAIEFLDVCEAESYREVIFSMKASNAQVAIQAYRLLAARLAERSPGQPSYPFHVGVTEAGDGEDGRIKSAIGIGALLEDGIGDTIRVSLTEQPVREVPVAAALARRAELRWAEDRNLPTVFPGLDGKTFCDDPYAHARRATRTLDLGGSDLELGGTELVRVELDLGALPEDPAATIARLATSLALLPELPCEGLRVRLESANDLPHARAFCVARDELELDVSVAADLSAELVTAALAAEVDIGRYALLVGSDESLEVLAGAIAELFSAGRTVELSLDGALGDVAGQVERALEAVSLARASNVFLSLRAGASGRATHDARKVAAILRSHGADLPLMLRFDPRGPASPTNLLDAAIDLGAPLCDGIGDAVSVPTAAFASAGEALDITYRILQGARLRTTRTEYISCPSCGRTLFDLEETTARIKERTDHLQGVKIAVMGCIVNGPGEMADADFGYVGSGVGTVTLYVGKEIVARGVPEETAPDRLVRVIKDAGKWLEVGTA